MSGMRPVQSTPAAISKNMSTQVFSESAKKQKGKASKLLLDGIDLLQAKWPVIPRENQEKIFSYLINFFETVNFRLLTVKEQKQLKKAESEKTMGESAKALKDRQHAVREIKKDVVFGINEITKGLERNALSVVIVDRSAKPYSFISHIPALAASTEIPAAALENLAITLAPKIGITSVIAFAFKKNLKSSSAEDVVQKLLPLIPKILAPGNQKKVSPLSDDAEMEELQPSIKSEVSAPEVRTAPLDKSLYSPLQIKTVVKNENRVTGNSGKKNKKAGRGGILISSAKRKQPDA
ncbi:ribonuclease P protein subunit p38-like [Paramacrobiotus metropolitanus]|uniref:ribonuclease P protein subunit p38-like n=1 Tax=Paramacrobiotus metropolitanus TaxID=2943436 RepID=UPI002446109D|nr:ribonuclease P protein subunit p38-like [Paramacrobiotus metropolitanus]